MSRADNSVKNRRNLPNSNPKPDLLNINACTKFGLNPLTLTQLSSGNENLSESRADNSIKIGWNLPTSNPKPDLHNINARTKFGENPLIFSQVIIWKRNTDGGTIDGWMDRHTDIQRETIIPCHYHVAGYKNEKIHLTPLNIGRGQIYILQSELSSLSASLY